MPIEKLTKDIEYLIHVDENIAIRVINIQSNSPIVKGIEFKTYKAQKEFDSLDDSKKSDDNYIHDFVSVSLLYRLIQLEKEKYFVRKI